MPWIIFFDYVKTSVVEQLNFGVSRQSDYHVAGLSIKICLKLESIEKLQITYAFSKIKRYFFDNFVHKLLFLVSIRATSLSGYVLQQLSAIELLLLEVLLIWLWNSLLFCIHCLLFLSSLKCLFLGAYSTALRIFNLRLFRLVVAYSN